MNLMFGREYNRQQEKSDVALETAADGLNPNRSIRDFPKQYERPAPVRREVVGDIEFMSFSGESDLSRLATDPALGPSSLPTRLRVSLSDNFGTDNDIKVF